ncbi:MAG TPA: hypothetical protein VEI55_02730 [Candidatus Acidoferrum sp.]|nr:hypothetical protein [Candidatus Acidoferrum sp.]
MAETLPLEISPKPLAKAVSSTTATPWYVWSGVLAVSFITFGLYWDISWHMTIGRDTFWTPAHLAIHFGGILAAITCTYLIFSATFGEDARLRELSVRVWGFRGPLGAFFTAWGGAMMLTSAPFDNWWHASFGLDVQILSPPHFVLGLGINGVVLGSTLLVLSRMNRSEGAEKSKLVRILLYLAGLQLVLHMMLIYEYSDAALMHSTAFYRALTIGVPVILITYGRVSGCRWGSTIIASVYTGFMLVTTWVFPLFPASPKLGPVYTNVTHMLPLGFPMLLLPPAFLLDLTATKVAKYNRWVQAGILGTVYLAALFAAHWPFALVLISPHARNWFFGQGNIPYFVPPSVYHLFYQLRRLDPTPTAFLAGMGIAWGSAIVSSRAGIAIGDAMKRLRR